MRQSPGHGLMDDHPRKEKNEAKNWHGLKPLIFFGKNQHIYIYNIDYIYIYVFEKNESKSGSVANLSLQLGLDVWSFKATVLAQRGCPLGCSS